MPRQVLEMDQINKERLKGCRSSSINYLRDKIYTACFFHERNFVERRTIIKLRYLLLGST